MSVMRFRLSRLAENVKREREAAGLSQRALARAAGLSQPTVLAIEQGSSPSMDSVVRIARALNVALNDLIDDAPRTIEEMIPGWGTLTAGEQYHFRALIASIAESRGARGLRAAEDPAPYLGANADAIEEARRESERLSDSEDEGEDGGEQRQRRRGGR